MRVVWKTIPLLLLIGVGCQGFHKEADSAAEAVKIYLDCLEHHDTKCLIRLLPPKTTAMLKDATRGLKLIKKKAAKEDFDLGCLIGKARIPSELLEHPSLNTVLAHSLGRHKNSLSAIVTSAKKRIRWVRKSGEQSWRVRLLDGREFEVLRIGPERFYVVPQSWLRAKINRIAGAVSYALILLKKSKVCKRK